MNVHIFSLHLAPSSLTFIDGSPSTCIITDADAFHRIATVLRLAPGDLFEVFTTQQRYRLELMSLARKKQITCAVKEVHIVPAPRTHVALAIGLLKRDAMEEAVYNAAQAGADTIIPLITEKSRRKWISDKEPERLRAIAIAACEQAKNYYIPDITPLKTLPEFARTLLSGQTIGFDVTGGSLAELVEEFAHTPLNYYTLIVGSEGGFTQAEMSLLSSEGTRWFQLTKTILRSKEAVTFAVCCAKGLIQ